MHYRLEYEHEKTWESFHHNAPARPMELHFERKYVWYLDTTSIAISPRFSKLNEARQWFQLMQLRSVPSVDRRNQVHKRRFENRFGAIAFAAKYDRRSQKGRRWTDQLAKFAF